VTSPPGTSGVAALRLLHPRVRLLWRLGSGIRAVVWTAGAAALEHWGPGRVPFPDFLPPGALTAGVAVFWTLVLLILPGLRYRRWRYALRDADLWIRRGILVHQVSVIPYRRLQFVDTRQGPLERWLGLTELVVHTAAPGTSGLIPGLESEEAESLRERLARFAPEGEDEGA
jgi:membrane protein YdbS with pleckstrin-like domain